MVTTLFTATGSEVPVAPTDTLSPEGGKGEVIGSVAQGVGFCQFALQAAIYFDIVSAHAAILKRTGCRPEVELAINTVKGPASYFPSIEAKYGRPIGEWKDLIRSQDGKRHMELVAWLKQEYGLGHGHANALVADTLRK